MKPFFTIAMLLASLFPHVGLAQQLTILQKTYDEVTHSGVTLHWTTDIPADSKVFWMVSDSNDQPVQYTDTLYVAESVTTHSVLVGNLSAGTMYRYMVVSSSLTESDSSTGYFITRSTSSGDVSVWFNHSVDVSVSTGVNANGNTDFLKLIKTQIDKANYSIDMTLWDFEQLDSVAAYLIRAKERGVKIRFVYNHVPDSPPVEMLKAAGINIVKRLFDTTFVMHNKFWIFDHRYNSNPSNQYLWTGSTNVTHPQFHSDRNNVIIIQDQALCEVYTREFEEMWGSHTDEPDTARSKFGTQKTDNVAHILNVGGVRMEVFFAPTDSIADTLVSLFSTRPVKSIYFSMLKFVLPDVESALHEAWQRGILVSGVFDSSCSIKSGSAFPRMKGHAVPGAWQPPADVFIDTITGLLHHKYSLINADTTAGEKIVTTGSFNWELPAQHGNDENMLVLYDAGVNNLYFQEFMARYKESGGMNVGSGWGQADPLPVNGLSGLNIFPNPFSRHTVVQFLPGNHQSIHLEIFDGTGRRHLFRKIHCPGTEIVRITLDGTMLPSGPLLLRLYGEDFHQSMKIIRQ
jgi:phosphatidylserine/phosphatidylglycerophosphate/cardiolipin synthase-like enzyme